MSNWMGIVCLLAGGLFVVLMRFLWICLDEWEQKLEERRQGKR